jgi:hypothetical protein
VSGYDVQQFASKDSVDRLAVALRDALKGDR